MKKQLIIQLARLGDILQTKRLMLSLKSESSLTLLVDKNLISLAQKIYPYANIIGIHINNKDANIVFEENRQVFADLQKENFDIVYPLNSSPFSQAILNLFPPEKLRGYSRTYRQTRQSTWVQYAFSWMQNRKVSPLNLMDFWANFAPSPIDPRLVNKEAKAGGKGLGVVLSGQNPKRSLAPKHYAKIVHAVYERLQSQNQMGTDKVFLFGTKYEEAFAKEFILALPKKLQGKVHNFAGKTNLEELLERVEGLDLLLTPDTGIAHIAAHLAVPVEAFYLSSANCFETGPYGLGHTVWQTSMEHIENKRVACSPCTEFQDCPFIKDENQTLEMKVKKDYSDLPCHKAFQSPALLMRLDENKYTKAMLDKYAFENIIVYHSSFDEYFQGIKERTGTSFGLTWQGMQNEKHKKARQELRTLLYAYIDATKIKHADYVSSDFPPLFNTELYSESDWVFPKKLP